MIRSFLSSGEIWGLNIEFNHGDFIQVKAPSGAGKSTLMGILYGIRKDFKGDLCFDGSIVTNNPTLIGHAYAKEILETENIKIFSIGSGQNKNKISGPSSTKWGGMGWLRNDIMGMLLDSEINNDISKNLFKDNYLRVNSPRGKINRFLDDYSDENLEQIHLMGMEWWSKFGEEALKFIDD